MIQLVWPHHFPARATILKVFHWHTTMMMRSKHEAASLSNWQKHVRLIRTVSVWRTFEKATSMHSPPGLPYCPECSSPLATALYMACLPKIAPISSTYYKYIAYIGLSSSSCSSQHRRGTSSNSTLSYWLTDMSRELCFLARWVWHKQQKKLFCIQIILITKFSLLSSNMRTAYM